MYVLLVAAAIAVVGYVLVQLRAVIMPLIAGLFFATLLVSPARWLARRGCPDGLAAVAVMAASVAAPAAVGAAIAPTVAGELDDLGRSARAGLDQVATWLVSGPLGISPADVDRVLDRGLEELRANSQVITTGVLSGALVAVEVVAGLLLTVVIVFFLVKDGDQIWRWVVDLLPRSRRADARELGQRAWSTLSAYLRGVAVVALVNAIFVGIALALIGVPLILPLVVLTFLGAFFPLVGTVVVGLVVALVSEGVAAAVLVIAAITVIQQLEGDLLYPVVVGRLIRLHPLAILLALTTGTAVAGVVGALLAVLLAAVGWTVVSYLRSRGDEARAGTVSGGDSPRAEVRPA